MGVALMGGPKISVVRTILEGSAIGNNKDPPGDPTQGSPGGTPGGSPDPPPGDPGTGPLIIGWAGGRVGRRRICGSSPDIISIPSEEVLENLRCVAEGDRQPGFKLASPHASASPR